ncbi:MAG TPA: UPF0149 family protein [Burkholderiaceae bacterium]|nr:UPF0149 family protein [Burkholderiaceae bacterium]
MEALPGRQAPTTDLSDAEFRELDELLAAAPAPLAPMDVVMLDGFLCGLIVQPERIAPERWLPWALDAQGRAFAADPAWSDYPRARTLMLRRHAALMRAIEGEQGWFDPFILEPEEAHPDADQTPAQDEEDAALAALGPISRPLAPWVAGFHFACSTFDGLFEQDEPAIATTLARLWRHLPIEDDAERELVALMDREAPLASLDEAIGDLAGAVVELADLTRDARYRVDTVRRETPKVGRNDPCPCGSGRKFKACHGRGG